MFHHINNTYYETDTNLIIFTYANEICNMILFIKMKRKRI